MSSTNSDGIRKAATRDHQYSGFNRHPRVLRKGEALIPLESMPSSSLVVRGGTKRGFKSLVDDIEDAIDQGYGPVLSVYVGEQLESESYLDALHRLCKDADIPHGKVQVARLGQLRESDIQIERYVENGWAETHCHVIFSVPLRESEVDSFSELFSDPEVNPTGGRKRR